MINKGIAYSPLIPITNKIKLLCDALDTYSKMQPSSSVTSVTNDGYTVAMHIDYLKRKLIAHQKAWQCLHDNISREM